ncbi:WAT1-related protein [Citrus sinensis]|uniref:WAT1-related protein n=1 Tax=Citrus sinensis TaxID=2711 RepID=A0ACB8K463_CITSI|nr:WAT1-related protein [Citrus sinensis]
MNPPMLKSVISLDSWLSPGRGHLGHLLKLIPPGRGDLLKLIPPGRGGLLKLIAHGRGGLLKLIPPGRGVIAPFALVLERPVIDQNFYYAGLKFTSPTFSCGMSNMLPAMTFVMAVLCSTSTVIHPHLSLRQLLLRTKTGLIKGSILLILATLAWASFFILQPVTIRRYPAHLSLTAIVCFLGTLQSAAVTFVMEHKDSVRTIGWDLNLLAAAYAGIVSSGIAYYVQGLVMQKRGPVFATAFSHLMMIIVAIMGSFLLAEKIYVGGVLGAVLIVIGLYAVLWGKYKEMVPEAVENIEMVLKLWRTRTHFGNN